MAFTLTAGIIGYHISATLAKSLLSLPRLYPELNCQIRLKSLCGRNREAVRAAAQTFGFERSTDRWQELVEDPDIDLLINGGPNFLHAQPCLRALEMNKHVFCEKPLARSVAEAKTMVETADRVSGPAMVGYNYRFVPAVISAGVPPPGQLYKNWYRSGARRGRFFRWVVGGSRLRRNRRILKEGRAADFSC
jgi:predicted dehydrogenase